MKKRIYVYATEDKEILGAFLTFNSLKEVVIDNLTDYNLNLSSNTIEEMKNCKDIKDFEKMLSYLSIVDFVGAIEVDFDMKEGAKLVDEQQTVPCIICAVEEEQVTVEIIKDVDIHWIDEEGNAHTDHLINGEKMKFDKEFIEV